MQNIPLMSHVLRHWGFRRQLPNEVTGVYSCRCHGRRALEEVCVSSLAPSLSLLHGHHDVSSLALPDPSCFGTHHCELNYQKS